MAKPVNNWHSLVGEVPLFWDIADADLRHYGPRAAWRDLSRRDLGTKKAIFSGVIDLGYNTDELKAIATASGAKRIVPLSLSGLNDQPVLRIAIPAPHAGGLVPLNSLPFPQYRLTITVDLEAKDVQSLIRTIEEGWAARSLLMGRFEGSADGCVASGGYKVTIDPKSCITEIIAATGKQEFSIAAAWQAVTEAVHKHASSWISYYGNAPSAEELALAKATLVGVLTQRCLTDYTVIQYDNGMSAGALRLREAATMANAEARVLVRTTAEKLAVEVAF